VFVRFSSPRRKAFRLPRGFPVGPLPEGPTFGQEVAGLTAGQVLNKIQSVASQHGFVGVAAFRGESSKRKLPGVLDQSLASLSVLLSSRVGVL
jgi:hypothetical protein